MAAPLLAAGIAAGASLLGTGINAAAAGSMNRRAERFSREMYDRQRADSLSDWHMQNAYNDPAAQMQRLQSAGLNPNLVYGNGATTEAGNVRASQAQTPRYDTPQVDFNSVVQQAMATRQLQANIARTEAETRSIDERTVGVQFQNELNASIGISEMKRRYQTELSRMTTQDAKEIREFDAWVHANFDAQDVSVPIRSDRRGSYQVSDNSLIVKAQRAGIDRTFQELDNAKKLGDIRAAEAAIKQFEKRLTDQGLSPNSPWYMKAIMGIYESVFGQQIRNLHQ